MDETLAKSEVDVKNEVGSARDVIENTEETSKSEDVLSKDAKPSATQMVLSALKNIKKRKGISYQAIKKFISITYKSDLRKTMPFVKRFLKSGVSSGILQQVTGKGARGSFKLMRRRKGLLKRQSKTSSKMTESKSKRTKSNLLTKIRPLSTIHKSTSTSRISLKNVNCGPSECDFISVSTLTEPFVWQS